MSRFGLIGGSYTSQSVNADSEMTMNWYPETIEANGNSQMALYNTPGLSLFCDLTGVAVLGLITFNGRTFGVTGTTFWEIFADGTKVNRGTIAADLNLVSMVAGPNQVLIASAGIPYVFNLTTNVLTAVNPALLANVAQVEYMDGFYIALLKNSNTIQSSNPDDATTWAPGTQQTSVSLFPDMVMGIKVMHERIVTLGLKASTAYYDAGSFPFPFAADPSAGVIEQGTSSEWGQVILDNTLFWIGQDSRGAGIAWRANGYTPTRVSTHAEEYAWSKYPARTSDVIAYGYQELGHTFYVAYFPSGNATWVYDVATGLWHQRGTWTGTQFTAHPSQCHVYCFGQHLVGDYASGKVYTMSSDYLSDAGTQVRRVRHSPHISNEQQWILHHYVQLDMESGLGPQPPLLDGAGLPRDPIISIRWSDDGGHTWSNYHDLPCGQAGQYAKRVILRRLGRSRDRVYEISAADPIPYRIIEGYLEATPGFQAQERIATQLRKIS